MGYNETPIKGTIMPSNFWKYTTVALAVALACDMRVARHFKEAHETDTKKISALHQFSDHLIDEVNFLSAKLDEAGVPVTEFDRIAFRNMT